MKRALLLASVLLTLAAPPADAGTYTVFSCKTPSGNPAPTDGWSHMQQGGAFSSPSDACAAGGGLEGSLNGDFAQGSGSRLGWRFSVPDSLELAGFRLWRHFSTTSAAETNATPYAYVSWPSPEYSPDARDACVAGAGCRAMGGTGGLSSADVFEAGAMSDDVRSVYVLAGCGGSDGCVDRNSATPMARAVVKAFAAKLRDTTAPVAGPPSGPLASNPIHTGLESLSFNASDTGSGVYRTVVEVRAEGSTAWGAVAAQVVDDNNGDCADADPTNSDPYEFVRRVPCKLQAGGTVTLDTRTVPNGTNELRVVLEDASGNRSTVLGPTRFPVTNADGILGPTTNGTNAANGVRIAIDRRGVRRARHLRFGQRHRLIATVRNEAGKPVVGATVEVLQRVKLPGAGYTTARKPVTTGRRGQVRWTVPAGPSRRIRLAYKANVLNGTYQATTDIPFEVDAATTFKPNRRSFRNGQTIRFSGRVRSKPIPRGGVLIDLQAKRPGAKWSTFATKRTSKRGRWSVKYRLRSTTRTTRYAFRARIRQDSGYPYSASSTKAVSVLVRP